MYRIRRGLANMRTRISIYKKGAKNRGLQWNITEEQFEEITQKDCYYCGAKPGNVINNKMSNGRFVYNGLDRVDNNKGYTVDNVVPCCNRCNQSKRNLTLEDYKNWIKNSYHKLFASNL